jgi:hypothetical protein
MFAKLKYSFHECGRNWVQEVKISSGGHDDVLSIGAQVEVGLDDELCNVNNWIVMSSWNSYERHDKTCLVVRLSDRKKCEEFLWFK